MAPSTAACNWVKDMWSVNTQTYPGITAHWITNDELQRESVVLVCCRFVGCHTYSKIVKATSDVHGCFDVDVRKITHMGTDGAIEVRQ